MKNKVIGSPLINPKSNIVTYSDQVQDIVTGKKQSEINNDVTSLKDAISNVGSRTIYTLNFSDYDNKVYLPLEEYDFQIGDVLQLEMNLDNKNSTKGSTGEEEPVKTAMYYIVLSPQKVSIPNEDNEENGPLKSVLPPSYTVTLLTIGSYINYDSDNTIINYDNDFMPLVITEGTYGEDYTKALIIKNN